MLTVCHSWTGNYLIFIKIFEKKFFLDWDESKMKLQIRN